MTMEIKILMSGRPQAVSNECYNKPKALKNQGLRNYIDWLYHHVDVVSDTVFHQRDPGQLAFHKKSFINVGIDLRGCLRNLLINPHTDRVDHKPSFRFNCSIYRKKPANVKS